MSCPPPTLSSLSEVTNFASSVSTTEPVAVMLPVTSRNWPVDIVALHIGESMCPLADPGTSLQMPNVVESLQEMAPGITNKLLKTVPLTSSVLGGVGFIENAVKHFQSLSVSISMKPIR
jgi:hypothetical protein